MIDKNTILALHSSLQQDYVVAKGANDKQIDDILKLCSNYFKTHHIHTAFIQAACVSFNIYLERPFDSWNDLVAIRTAMAIIEEEGVLFDSFSLVYGFFESFEKNANPILDIALFFEKNSTRIKER